MSHATPRQASLLLLCSCTIASCQPIEPVESNVDLPSQLAALRAHADQVGDSSDGRPESLVNLFTGTADVLREGQQLAQRLQATVKASGQGAPPSLVGQIDMLGAVLQRIQSLAPVATAYKELTSSPQWKPPSPNEFEPAKAKLVEDALVKYLMPGVGGGGGGVVGGGSAGGGLRLGGALPGMQPAAPQRPPFAAAGLQGAIGLQGLAPLLMAAQQAQQAQQQQQQPQQLQQLQQLWRAPAPPAGALQQLLSQRGGSSGASSGADLQGLQRLLAAVAGPSAGAGAVAAPSRAGYDDWSTAGYDESGSLHG